MLINLFLMHLDQKCAFIEADICFDRIDILNVDVINPHLIPVMCKNIENKRHILKQWWKMRSIPSGRREYYNLMRSLFEIPANKRPLVNETSLLLSLLSYGQSLTDKYWINPEKDTIIPLFRFTNSSMEDIILKTTTYNEINYYDNQFSNELDKFFILTSTHAKINTYNTPSFSLNGNTQKFWKKENDKFFIYKYLYNVKELMNNELIINSYLKMHYKDLATNTKLVQSDILSFDQFSDINKPLNFIVSENFTDKDTEFIPASEIMLVSGKFEGDVYDVLKEGCDILGIKDIDYVLNVANEIEEEFGIKEERSFDNFGFIRDAKTRVFLKPAPLFGNTYYKYILER